MSIKINSLLFDQWLGSYFNMLMLTGCRPEEVWDESRWSIGTGNKIILATAKGNNQREWYESEVDGLFYNQIYNNEKAYSIYSLDKYNFYFERFNYLSTLMVETKKIKSYLFRYYYIRNLKNIGMSNSDIITKMGWTNASNLSLYLNNDIKAIFL
jgi:hypothetical protein